MQLGLVVKKVHSVYIFRQERFLADFIQDNIEARKSATCPIKKKCNQVYFKQHFWSILNERGQV